METSDPGASEPTAVIPTPVPAPLWAGPAVGQVLPMYFVGDESHSMAGDPIAAVNQGLIDLGDAGAPGGGSSKLVNRSGSCFTAN